MTIHKPKFSVILTGLGHIGAGRGVYDRAWNSHLGSLRVVPWVEQIWLNDPYIDMKPLLGGKVFEFDQNQPPNITNRLLLVDAGPEKGRLTRYFNLNRKFNVDWAVLEKPNNYTQNDLKQLEAIDKIRINYFRRGLPSTLALKEHLGDEITHVKLKYNFGARNTSSHFFDLLDFLGFPLQSMAELEITRDHNALKIGENIELEKVSSTNLVFDIEFQTSQGTVHYQKLGKIIQTPKKLYEFDDLDQRFRYIYDTPCSINKLTSVKTDILIDRILQRISKEN